jgi:predicted nucleotidyltransferase
MSEFQELSMNRQKDGALAAERCAHLLKQQFGAKEVYIFGSVAEGRNWHSRSDIDLAVEGLAPASYISALCACYELLPAGMELDLITLETAPPALVRKAKMEEPMSQDDPRAVLSNEIAVELDNLQRLVDEAELVIASATSPSSVQLRALGSIVHDFYTACERVFERIAVNLGPGLPSGENWHTSLLRLMELDIEGTRTSVIDHKLASQLNEYLRFRHLFRHTYGYELEWEKLQPLVDRLPAIDASLSEQLKRFVEALA